MRAITQQSFGGPEVLQVVERPVPVPGPGQVLVRVQAIGTNPVDAFVRSGGYPLLGEPPFVLGWDLAGVIEQVGPGVTRPVVGEAVFGMPAFPAAAQAYAEYVVAAADELAPIPDGLDTVRAAALPLAGLTAWQCLVTAADVQPGQHVLVHGAGGGVGHLAVQIAKARGAVVSATASQGKAAFVKELGADTVIDYRAQDFAAVLHDVDIAVDLVGNGYGARTLTTLRPGGLLVAVIEQTPELRELTEQAGHRYAEIAVRPDAEGLAGLAELARSGRLTVHVQQTYPLEQAAQVHALLQASPGAGSGSGITGKLVLIP